MATKSIDDKWALRTLLGRIPGSRSSIAEQLGISKRTMRRYCCGDWPVPRPVWLALQWLAEEERRKLESIPFPELFKLPPPVVSRRAGRAIE